MVLAAHWLTSFDPVTLNTESVFRMIYKETIMEMLLLLFGDFKHFLTVTASPFVTQRKLHRFSIVFGAWNLWTLHLGVYMFLHVSVCVCECERETQREKQNWRESSAFNSSKKVPHKKITNAHNSQHRPTTMSVFSARVKSFLWMSICAIFQCSQ